MSISCLSSSSRLISDGFLRGTKVFTSSSMRNSTCSAVGLAMRDLSALASISEASTLLPSRAFIFATCAAESRASALSGLRLRNSLWSSAIAGQSLFP